MKRSLSVEATSCGDSADGLVGDDVIGDVIQSQDSAGSLHSRRKKKRRRRGDPVASYSATSRFGVSDSKTIRRSYSVQSQRKDIQSQCFEHPVARRFRQSFWTTRRKQQQHPVESLFVSAVSIYSVASYSVQSQDIQAQRIEEVAEDESSHSDDSAANQLTTYQSWMSTAELNSKWRKRQ
ncbi:hypothetical protein F511_23865 [Dorcoceras hygrometricum]|uniref:Uncharacterized protein n=1 Tax=Dorcoceras hygrometricum TaxID=472368 RepID=A0A2Z7CID3_9LAMI|nr:hypothetical protein F511_23865 [Dorcoceras hygrometricum]